MFTVSMWILSLFSTKTSWQKLDCKKSKNSIESVDKPINLILSSNSLFRPPSQSQVVLAPLSCLFLLKFLLALEWVIHLFFGHHRFLE